MTILNQSEQQELQFPGWRQKLAERRRNSTMKVMPRSLTDMSPWGLHEITSGTAFCRADQKFFSLRGFTISNGQREVLSWTQPMLYEEGTGVVVLVCDEEGRLLVSYRQEPGNDPTKGYILLGPTLQTSRANLEQAHGGKLPPRSELYTNEAVKWFDVPQDGGRFFGKTVRTGILEVPDIAELNPTEDELVINSFEDLTAAFMEGECNLHLISAVFTYWVR